MAISLQDWCAGRGLLTAGLYGLLALGFHASISAQETSTENAFKGTRIAPASSFRSDWAPPVTGVTYSLSDDSVAVPEYELSTAATKGFRSLTGLRVGQPQPVNAGSIGESDTVQMFSSGLSGVVQAAPAVEASRGSISSSSYQFLKFGSNRPAQAIEDPKQHFPIGLTKPLSGTLLPDAKSDEYFDRGPSVLLPASPLVAQMNAKPWVSPDLFWQPLYFEDPALERYGHHVGVWQPAVSAACFMKSVVFLPYHFSAHPPHEREYGLGFERPGNCVWPRRQIPEISPRGVIGQAAAVTGLIFIF